MIVCHCTHTTDRDVALLVQAGARDADAVLAACGAGGACGGCRPLVRLLVEKERRLAAADSAPAGASVGEVAAPANPATVDGGARPDPA